MARPLKSGIDYFALDVVLDTKFELIEAEFGLNGFGVVVKLYQKVYEHGYYIEWTNEVALLFAKRIGLGGDAVSEIIKASIKRGIFDKDLYEKYRILTSRGIQKRYFEAISRRKQVEVDSRYLLVDAASICENTRINLVNVAGNPQKDCENAQSKEKQTKVKQSKAQGALRHGAPTLEEIIQYCKKRENRLDPQRFFDYYQARGWVLSNGCQAKDWKALVRSWEHRQQQQTLCQPQQQKLPQGPPADSSSLDLDKLREILHRGGA
ncbi:MAG: DUF4373 domain-containing protein [Anaerotruncus sp.]|nr:DUF4373 domain-containing protein [Anaerotruncus sp.]